MCVEALYLNCLHRQPGLLFEAEDREYVLVSIFAVSSLPSKTLLKWERNEDPNRILVFEEKPNVSLCIAICVIIRNKIEITKERGLSILHFSN